MKLVSSNAPSTVHDVTARAFESWNANDSDFKASIKILTELKGIGPATASLILSVYDPDNAIFFSDECFGWLVGTDKTIKYNMAEYQTLFENSHEIMGRLNVTAMQIEQVAYVIMRESVKSSQSTKLAGTSGQSKKKADAADTDSNTADTSSDPPHLATQTAKRKTLNDDAQIEGAEDQGRRKALRSSTRNTSSHRDNPLN